MIDGNVMSREGWGGGGHGGEGREANIGRVFW